MNMAMGTKDRPWRARKVLQNGESATNFLAGNAVILAVNGTGDGYTGVLPSTAGAAKTNSLFQGVAAPLSVDPNSTSPGAGTPGAYVNIICAGWCPVTKLVKATKAASTDAWPSYAAGAIGDRMIVETVNNGFVNAGSIASTALAGPAHLCETYASATTAASGAYTSVVAASATALTVNVKSYLYGLS